MAWQKCDVCNAKVEKPYISLCQDHNPNNLRKARSCSNCYTRKRKGGPGMAMIDDCEVLEVSILRDNVCDLWTGRSKEHEAILMSDALPTEPISKGGDGSSAKGREPEPEGGVGGEVMVDGRTTAGASLKGGNP